MNETQARNLIQNLTYDEKMQLLRVLEDMKRKGK